MAVFQGEYTFIYTNPETGETSPEVLIVSDSGGNHGSLTFTKPGTTDVVMKGLRIKKDLPILVMLFRKNRSRRFYFGRVTDLTDETNPEARVVRFERGDAGNI